MIDGAVAVNAASSRTVDVTVAALETVLFDKSSDSLKHGVGCYS